MKALNTQQTRTDRLIDALTSKLEAHRGMVDQSRKGKAHWSFDKDGVLHLDLEPRF